MSITLRNTKQDNLLSEVNKHPFDDRIKFREKDHKYWIDDNDENLISVTTFIHLFFGEFNTEHIINNILSSHKMKDPTYKYFNMTFDEIKISWAQNAKISSDAGTNLHADIEHFYNNLPVINESVEFKQFLNFYEKHQHLRPYRTEWMIFSELLRITGSVDIIFKNEDGKLIIGDWKRSKEIKKVGYNQAVAKFPFQHLPDCNFYQYSLQLNLYRTILERFYNEKVDSMFLVICHPDNENGDYQKLDVKRMDIEADYLIDFRIQQLIKIGYDKTLFDGLIITYRLPRDLENFIQDSEEPEIMKPLLLKRNLSQPQLFSNDNPWEIYRYNPKAKLVNTLDNKGKKWSSTENEDLVKRSKYGLDIQKIAIMHQRSESSIKLKLSENIMNITTDKNLLEKDIENFLMLKEKKTKDREKNDITKSINQKNNSIMKKEDEIEILSDKQQEAYETMIAGKNVFITGCAGTGKSRVIKKFCKEYEFRKNIAITSTTGVSAILLGGTTLHSYLGIGLGTDTAAGLLMRIKKNVTFAKRWRDLDVLIIDEVSMLDPALFDKLELIGCAIRVCNKPFGGIQLILSGDFLQLPPVRSELFCFESKSWNKCIDLSIYLTHNFRQTDDIFQKILSEVRINKLSRETIDLLRSREDVELVNEHGILPTKIYSLNRDVDRENEDELNKLLERNNDLEFFEYELEYVVVKKGLKNIDEKIKKNVNIPRTIQLCLGAQVMLLYNLDLDKELCNGSRGIIIGFSKETNMPIVKFLNGITRTIEYQSYNCEENGSVIFTYSQVPLRVSFAITAHKMQGCTIDYCIIDFANIFEYHQAYTALSRVRTLEGLSIRNLMLKNIKVHPKVLEFYEKLM